MVAPLLVSIQPASVEMFAAQCCAIKNVLDYATDGWKSEQKLQLENLLRSTPYEKSIESSVANSIALVLTTIVEFLGTSQICSQKIRAATTVLYVGLQSGFTAYQKDTRSSVNSVLRIAISLEQSIDVEKTTHSAFFTNWQLWHLSQHIVSFLENSQEKLDEIKLVGEFTQYATSSQVNIFSEKAFSHDLQGISQALNIKN